MEEERKFFNFCSETMKKYENLRSRFQTISSNYKRPPENYNPLKYVRGSKLIDEGFIHSNFPELNFSENLKEWKEKEKSGKKGVLTYEEYLKKAKEERLNAEGKQAPSNFSNQNPNLSKSSNSNAPASSSSGKFSYEDYKKQKGLNVQNTTPNKLPNQTPPTNNNNMSFNPGRDSLDFNNINNNFSYSHNNKLDPLNFNMPDNSPAAELNPYENIGLDNLNLNVHNPYNQSGNSYNQMSNAGFGFGGNNNFPMNNYNNTFPYNNQNNNNNNPNNNMNNDFFNINNLSFPK